MMVWLVVWRTIGWASAAMLRPLVLTTAWVYAILWVVLGPLNILLAFSQTSEWLIDTAAHIVQFALGYHLLRYLWRSSRPSWEDTVGRDAQKPAP